jgi:hypothetical protein
VSRLAEIHTKLTGSERGRRRNVAVLNKASIIFVTACWESYVEDVLMEGIGRVVAWAPGTAALTSDFRDGVKKRLTKYVGQGKAPASDLACWNTDAPGWKPLALTYGKLIFLEKFHTPSTENVNEKFRAALAIADLSASWHWKAMSRAMAEAKLDRYIGIRGDIAHRVHHDRPVHKSWPTAYLDHVARLVDKSDATVRAGVLATTGTAPW